MSFDVFWQIFPRKVGKLDAEKAYGKAIKKAEEHIIRGAALRYADECKGKEEQFIAHPATWLNQGRWMDEKVKAVENSAASRVSREFPPEYRVPERPRAETWANVWVPQNAPQFLDMLERSTRADPREFRIEEGGIWVARKWLLDDSGVYGVSPLSTAAARPQRSQPRQR